MITCRNQLPGMDYSVFPQKGYAVPAQNIFALYIGFSHITKRDHKGKGNTRETLIPSSSVVILKCATSSPKWRVHWLLFQRELWFCLFTYVFCLIMISTCSNPIISDSAERLDPFLRISQMEMESGRSQWESFTAVFGVGGELLGGTGLWEPVMSVGPVGGPLIQVLESRDIDSVREAPERQSGKLNPCLLLAAKKRDPQDDQVCRARYCGRQPRGKNFLKFLGWFKKKKKGKRKCLASYYLLYLTSFSTRP